MAPPNLQTQLLALTPPEKAQALQLLLNTLGYPNLTIHKTPNVCGGDACIGNTRIPVWSLVLDRRLGLSDAQILEAFPSLNAADLVNAWIYADTHPTEIETAIQENQAIDVITYGADDTEHLLSSSNNAEILKQALEELKGQKLLTPETIDPIA
jgi:uncharacterized protein (DUF433 family)